MNAGAYSCYAKIQLYDNDDYDSAVAKVGLKHQIYDKRLRSVRGDFHCCHMNVCVGLMSILVQLTRKLVSLYSAAVGAIVVPFSEHTVFTLLASVFLISFLLRMQGGPFLQTKKPRQRMPSR